jgi:hypothetical protein
MSWRLIGRTDVPADPETKIIHASAFQSEHIACASQPALVALRGDVSGWAVRVTDEPLMPGRPLTIAQSLRIPSTVRCTTYADFILATLATAFDAEIMPLLRLVGDRPC